MAVCAHGAVCGGVCAAAAPCAARLHAHTRGRHRHTHRTRPQGVLRWTQRSHSLFLFFFFLTLFSFFFLFSFSLTLFLFPFFLFFFFSPFSFVLFFFFLVINVDIEFFSYFSSISLRSVFVNLNFVDDYLDLILCTFSTKISLYFQLMFSIVSVVRLRLKHSKWSIFAAKQSRFHNFLAQKSSRKQNQLRETMKTMKAT